MHRPYFLFSGTSVEVLAPSISRIVLNVLWKGLHSVLLQDLITSLLAFFQFYPVISRKGNVQCQGVLFFFCWLSLRLVVSRDYMVNLYLQTPKYFVLLIFQYEFSVVHIPFVRLIKFKLFEQFPVDHRPYFFVSNIILSLH